MIDAYSLSPENRQRLSYLSSFLREMRVNSGYTQEQVAREINLSRNSISKIENIGFFRIQHLFILADFYEIPINELFSELYWLRLIQQISSIVFLTKIFQCLVISNILQNFIVKLSLAGYYPLLLT